MQKLISLVLFVALTLPLGLAQPKKAQAVTAPSSVGNVEDLTAAQLKAYLTFIASDELEGRSTPSRGLNITAKFIAAMLERWGVQPGGENGTYFQKIILQRSQLQADKTFVQINGQQFKYGDDFLVTANAPLRTVTGNCVFVSHGYIVKSKNVNAYQTAAGLLDVKDKILIVGGGLPKGVTAQDLSGQRSDNFIDATDYAEQHGAKAIIRLPNSYSLANWKTSQVIALQRKALEPQATEVKSRLPEITASQSLLNSLLAGEKMTGAALYDAVTAGETVEGFTLDKSVTITLGGELEQVPTQNVIGILPGTDPTLKSEYVAMGAHYDHVGNSLESQCIPMNGDSICNGADDDGSGTTAVLALAETFAKGARPKRSLLFIWHCGEERGLWGSEYFTSHPTVELKQIITELNIDMIGRSKKAGDTDPRNRELSGPHEIYVIGSKMLSSELGTLSERVNQNFLKLTFNYKYDDPRDPNHFFSRSDHFNYANKGVPIIFYFDGEHEDYHRPSDQVEKIDFQKMEKVARTVYATAWELGNSATRPRVDKKLPVEASGN
ncbi:MAG: M28 family peptidase [Blastocatellia bacterium]